MSADLHDATDALEEASAAAYAVTHSGGAAAEVAVALRRYREALVAWLDAGGEPSAAGKPEQPLHRWNVAPWLGCGHAAFGHVRSGA